MKRIILPAAVIIMVITGILFFVTMVKADDCAINTTIYESLLDRVFFYYYTDGEGVEHYRELFFIEAGTFGTRMNPLGILEYEGSAVITQTDPLPGGLGKVETTEICFYYVQDGFVWVCGVKGMVGIDGNLYNVSNVDLIVNLLGCPNDTEPVVGD